MYLLSEEASAYLLDVFGYHRIEEISDEVLFCIAENLETDIVRHYLDYEIWTRFLEYCDDTDRSIPRRCLEAVHRGWDLHLRQVV